MVFNCIVTFNPSNLVDYPTKKTHIGSMNIVDDYFIIDKLYHVQHTLIEYVIKSKLLLMIGDKND